MKKENKVVEQIKKEIRNKERVNRTKEKKKDERWNIKHTV